MFSWRMRFAYMHCRSIYRRGSRRVVDVVGAVVVITSNISFRHRYPRFSRVERNEKMAANIVCIFLLSSVVDVLHKSMKRMFVQFVFCNKTLIRTNEILNSIIA